MPSYISSTPPALYIITFWHTTSISNHIISDQFIPNNLISCRIKYSNSGNSRNIYIWPVLRCKQDKVEERRKTVHVQSQPTMVTRQSHKLPTSLRRGGQRRDTLPPATRPDDRLIRRRHTPQLSPNSRLRGPSRQKNAREDSVPRERGHTTHGQGGLQRDYFRRRNAFVKIHRGIVGSRLEQLFPRQGRAFLEKARWPQDILQLFKPDPRIFSNFSTQMRILNPNVVQVAHNILNNTRKRPTSGLIAFVFATRVCDSVDLAGFAYNNPDPNATVHYYSKTLMSSLKNQGSPTNNVHDISKEVELMKTMAEANLVGDLSGVIWPSEKWRIIWQNKIYMFVYFKLPVHWLVPCKRHEWESCLFRLGWTLLGSWCKCP